MVDAGIVGRLAPREVDSARNPRSSRQVRGRGRRNRVGVGRRPGRIREPRLVARAVVRAHLVAVGGRGDEALVRVAGGRARPDLVAVAVDPIAGDDCVIRRAGPGEVDLARARRGRVQVRRVGGGRVVGARVVAGTGARVREPTSRRGDELPVVASRMEGQLEQAEGRRVSDEAVRGDVCDRGVVVAAGSHCELADPGDVVELPARGLRGEALVDVVVAVEDDVGVGSVEGVPERLGVRRRPPSGAEQRDVPVGGDALARVGGQVRRQPLPLGRSRAATPGVAAVRVQRDQVPRPDVVAVVALAGRDGARKSAEVVVVAGRALVRRRAVGPAVREVVVVTRRRSRDRLEAAPAQVVGVLVGPEAAALVLVVPERQNGCEVAVDDQVGRRQLAAGVRRPVAAVPVLVRGVAGDVPRGCDDGVAGCGRARRPGDYARADGERADERQHDHHPECVAPDGARPLSRSPTCHLASLLTRRDQGPSSARGATRTPQNLRTGRRRPR